MGHVIAYDILFMDAVNNEGAVTDSSAIDQRIHGLASANETWVGMPFIDRAARLRQVAASAVASGAQWVGLASERKGLAAGTPLRGEEWLSGPYAIATAAIALAESLERLGAGRPTVDIDRVHEGPGGRLVVDVFPVLWWERLLLKGYAAEVWMQSGSSWDDLLARARPTDDGRYRAGRVSVVLGAGNAASICVLDTLNELVAHNRSVVLKLNPVLDGMTMAIEEVLNPLISLGVVSVVSGGPELGSVLIHHPGVAHVHITGSRETHDAIVYGVGVDGSRRREVDAPLLSKPITSELGGVTPTIVIPTRWTRRDIDFQAEHVVTQRLHNAGNNCVATQVVLVPKHWAGKTRFLSRLRHHMRKAPARPNYYPGSAESLDRARSSGLPVEEVAPDRLLIVLDEIDARASQPTQTEYFAPVLCVVEVDAAGEEYLTRAAQFANEQLVGTLGANVLVHPRVISDLGARFEDFIESLRFGTVAINTWVALGYLIARAPWGAFPGNALNDVSSGIGVVHNALLLQRTERTIVRGPFTPWHWALIPTGRRTLFPRPPWFVTSKYGAKTSQLLVEFIGDPKIQRLSSVITSALRG